jgi:hypothetical protein
MMLPLYRGTLVALVSMAKAHEARAPRARGSPSPLACAAMGRLAQATNISNTIEIAQVVHNVSTPLFG